MNAALPSPARRHRRRPLLVIAGVLAALEVMATAVASAAIASHPVASVEMGAPVATTSPAAEVEEAPATRHPSPWLHLAAELVTVPHAIRSRAPQTSDQALDPRPPVVPAPVGVEAGPVDPAPVGDEAPIDPPPANAGDVTAAAAGGLAGAGRAAAAVPQRLRVPELGISQTVLQFPCDRAQPPDNFVYQWGCAGHNNLYLLGHAYSVFAPIHDAFAGGQLRVGMLATFTGSNGSVQTYRVATWRLVRPTDAAWAIADQPVPSMTLQTCYGANSEYRLLVRLVIVG